LEELSVPKPQKPQKRKMVRFRERAKCRFCRENVTYIDYKDSQTLQKLAAATAPPISAPPPRPSSEPDSSR